MKVTPNYVATLYQRSLKEGTAGLVRQPGRPQETAGASWEQALTWRAAGVRDAEIARRLGVNQSTVLRRLGRAHVAGPLPLTPELEPAEPGRGAGRRAAGARAGGGWSGGDRRASGGTGGAGGRGCRGRRALRSRYAGAMLLHAFLSRTAAGPVLAGAAAGHRGRGAADGGEHVLRARRRDDRAVQAPGRRRGRAAGRPGALPGLRALRPELARIADASRPAAGPVAVRGGDARRRTLCLPVSTTSMTTSSPTPARSPSRKAGTTSADGPSGAGRTRT